MLSWITTTTTNLMQELYQQINKSFKKIYEKFLRNFF